MRNCNDVSDETGSRSCSNTNRALKCDSELCKGDIEKFDIHDYGILRYDTAYSGMLALRLRTNTHHGKQNDGTHPSVNIVMIKTTLKKEAGCSSKTLA